MWMCDCAFGGKPPDTTKDPNCHNSGHDHHDPESPIVLARKAEYAAEKESEVARDRGLSPADRWTAGCWPHC